MNAAHFLATDVSGAACNVAKELATCKARAALLGATLHDLADEAGRAQYIVSRWHLTKAFDTLGDVHAWLSRMEGRRP